MKRLLALLLAIMMTVSLCACSAENDAADAASQTVLHEFGELESTSFELQMEYDADTVLIQGKIDLMKEIMLLSVSYGRDTYTVWMEGDAVSVMQESEGGLPRGITAGVNELYEELYFADLEEIYNTDITPTEEQLSHLADMFTGKEKLDLRYLEEIGIFPDIDAAFEEMGTTVEYMENILEAIISTVCDEEWIRVHYPTESETDGDVTSFSTEVDILAVMTELYSVLIRELGVSITEEEAREYASNATGCDTLTVKMDGSYTGIILTELNATVTADGEEAKVKLTVSEVNGTEVDTSDIKTKLTEAHGDYTECIDCGEEMLFFRGYCVECAEDRFCQNYCGNEPEEDGYCDDCRIPCAGGCGKHADREKGYCSDCYYEAYCSKDCGNEATQVDALGNRYCDECYAPCASCGEQMYTEYDGRCYTCYYSEYCNNDCGNKIIHFVSSTEGYCDKCYKPCLTCRRQTSEDDGRLGYCYECYYERYCREDCGEAAVHFASGYGYCYDCYDPCLTCDNQAKDDEKYNGYCSSCYYKKYCREDCGNVATNPTSGDYGYCDDCYDPCLNCEDQAVANKETYIGYCYGCYYKLYCAYRCGNVSTHFNSDDSAVGYCDECYDPCTVCGNQASEELDGYCEQCYYERYCYEQCGNEAVYFGPDDGYSYSHGYCEECYVKCLDCEYPAEIKGYCYECYYLKSCYYCGLDATQTFTDEDGLSFGFCDYCYQRYRDGKIAL